jgi:biotin transport system substrate-specific component
MTTATTLLMDRALPADRIARPLRLAILVLAGSALIALSARIQVPMWPVPMTMQTFAVLVIGMACGARLGAAIVAVYLLEGLVGLPVFASGAGPAYFAGPTGGYLIGFLISAAVVGALAERGWGRAPLMAFAAQMIGTAFIFVLGVGWLAALIGPDQAIAHGLLPFIPGAIVKAALAALLLEGLGRFFRRAG